MQNKRFLSTIGLLLTVFSVSSCSGGIDPNPDWTIDVEATKKDVQLLTYFPNSGKSGDFFQNSYIPQKLEEITGYKVTFNQTSEGGADTQVQTILTGKEPVDMLKISPTLFNNYVTQGYFTDLTDGLEKYAPNVMSLSKITEQQREACSYNGKIYAIPEVGHTTMNNLGLAWNMDHLASVGIDTMPSTISEFEEAMVALQTKYGGNANYHALGIAGTHADANPFSATFDVPKNWFVNENGELENVLFSDRTEQYLSYMHTLASRNMIASGWSGQSSSTVISNFVQGFSSCIVLSYWEWTPLRDSLVAAYPDFPSDVVTGNQKKAYVYGVEDHEYGVAPSDAMVQYNLYITGDGKYGTNYQEKGKVRDSHGIAYYITVPVASAKDAAYTLDWINYKQTEEVTILQIAGEENVHYQAVAYACVYQVPGFYYRVQAGQVRDYYKGPGPVIRHPHAGFYNFIHRPGIEFRLPALAEEKPEKPCPFPCFHVPHSQMEQETSYFLLEKYDYGYCADTDYLAYDCRSEFHVQGVHDYPCEQDDQDA